MSESTDGSMDEAESESDPPTEAESGEAAEAADDGALSDDVAKAHDEALWDLPTHTEQPSGLRPDQMPEKPTFKGTVIKFIAKAMELLDSFGGGD